MVDFYDTEYYGTADKVKPVKGLTQSEVQGIRTERESWSFGDGVLGAERRDNEVCPPYNELSPPHVDPEWKKLLAHFVSGFALLLELGSALCFVAYDIQSCDPACTSDNLYLGIVLISVVTLNAIFSYYQDGQAESAMANLKDTTVSICKVVRDGIEVTVDPADGSKFNSRLLVVGDIVIVGQGELVPADVYLTAGRVKVDNSSLTGEPDALPRKSGAVGLGSKTAAELDKHRREPFESTNLCFFGTACTEGEGQGVVVRMSDETTVGQIAKSLNAEAPETLMQQEIHHFVNIVSAIAIFLGVSMGILAFGPFDYPFIDAVVFMIGIIVANVPEGLLATITVALTLTAKKMADKNVLVKNVETVETLGSITVICSDKTGTLTQNNMITYRCQYDRKLRSCNLDYTWPLQAVARDSQGNEIGSVDVAGALWNGKTTPYFSLNDGCFERLLRCGMLCRTTVFRHTEIVTGGGMEGGGCFGSGTEAAIVTTIEEYYTKPIKARDTFGDASETGLVRFMEEIQYKKDEMLQWSKDVEFKSGASISRPVFTYDKVEAAQKAIKEGKMSLGGMGTTSVYTDSKERIAFLNQDTLNLFSSDSDSKQNDKYAYCIEDVKYSSLHNKFGWPKNKNATEEAMAGEANKQRDAEKASGLDIQKSWLSPMKTPEGTPLDAGAAAKVDQIRTNGVPYIETIKADFPEAAQLRFNSKNKFMCTLNEGDFGTGPLGGKCNHCLFIKGGSDVILKMSSEANIVLNTPAGEAKVKPMDDQDRSECTENMEEMSEAGERVLAFADCAIPDSLFVTLEAKVREEKAAAGDTHMGAMTKQEMCFTAENLLHPMLDAYVKENMVFLGNFSLMDPAREEVPAAVHECHTAGIQVIMVTGDHPKTASAIAAKIGIIEKKADALERCVLLDS